MEKEQSAVSGTASVHNAGVMATISNDHYDAFLEGIKTHFASVAGNAVEPLFTTNASDLYETYLDNLPESDRQVHTCNACRRFIENFGGLVTISETGETVSAMWSGYHVPDAYRPAVVAMETLVRKAKVTGVFYCEDKAWGLPKTGEWTHMAIVPPKEMVFKHSIQTAFQASAEKKEDFRTILSALNDFTLDVVQQAVKLLSNNALYRSEKCLGVAEWLQRLHEQRAGQKNSAHANNLTWLAVATAPAGFCHPRSSMIGTLLEDIISGYSFEDIERRFAAKMDPTKYQRPDAAPAAGNIAQGEKIIAKLNAAGSLRRRFATLADLETLWLPKAGKAEKPSGEGVFGHLTPKNAAPKAKDVEAATLTMTWDKFSRKVLPDALKIEMYVPYGQHNFSAMVTAAVEDAPPILQWDHEDKRNPVSWYVYGRGGSEARRWNLKAGQFHPVTAISLQPNMWGGNEDAYSHQGQGAFLILDGAKDMDCDGSGLAIFPELLKSEFHSIRSTIEAFSRNGVLEGQDNASACGLKLTANQALDVVLRVTTKNGQQNYKLDRWD